MAPGANGTWWCAIPLSLLELRTRTRTRIEPELECARGRRKSQGPIEKLFPIHGLWSPIKKAISNVALYVFNTCILTKIYIS
jgi:hypothetical protein